VDEYGPARSPQTLRLKSGQAIAAADTRPPPTSPTTMISTKPTLRTLEAPNFHRRTAAFHRLGRPLTVFCHHRPLAAYPLGKIIYNPLGARPSTFLFLFSAPPGRHSAWVHANAKFPAIRFLLQFEPIFHSVPDESRRARPCLYLIIRLAQHRAPNLSLGFRVWISFSAAGAQCHAPMGALKSPAPLPAFANPWAPSSANWPSTV